MARLTAKDGVVEIVPSDSGIKVLKEKDGVKTIEVDTPFKKKQKAISVDEFKAKAPKPKQEPQYPRNKKKKKKIYKYKAKKLQEINSRKQQLLIELEILKNG